MPSSIVDKDSGILIFFKDVHSLKANFPNELIDEGSVIKDNEEHDWKA